MSLVCSCSGQAANAVRIMFAEMDTRRAPREAQQDCTPRVLGSLDTGFSPTAAVPRAPPTTSSPAPNLIGSAVNGIPAAAGARLHGKNSGVG